MPYPNLGNFADQLELEGSGTAIDLFDFGNPYLPSSPEDELERQLDEMLRRLLEEGVSP